MVERLQVKASSIGRILNNLEKKYNNTHEKDDRIKKSPSGQQLGHSSHKRAPPKIQMIPPFNATKIRKSPSYEPTALDDAQELEELKQEVAKKQEE